MTQNAIDIMKAQRCLTRKLLEQGADISSQPEKESFNSITDQAENMPGVAPRSTLFSRTDIEDRCLK
jgi:hypothetical protein